MKKVLITLGAIVALAIGLAGANTMTANALLTACDLDGGSALCKDEGSKTDPKAVIKNVVNIILYIVGICAVIVIIISGLRYVMSAGNTQQATSARTSLVYAVVGLLVAILALGIVNFFLKETK